MKICTFNVNSVRARMDLILDWLEHRGHDIDILCLQEIKVVDELFPTGDFERLGFHCAVLGQKAYAGVAICSKQPFKDIRKGMGEKSWDEQKRVLAVHYPGLSLINIYAPHGGERGEDKFQYKLGWYERFVAYLDEHHKPEEPLVMVGDFNVARRDVDVWSPEALADTIGTMPEEREAFSSLLDWGLTDLHRSLNPDERTFTWWGYMGGAIWKDEGMRIDYVLCTAPLADRFSDIQVDLWPRKRRKPTPSDHAPLIADLDKAGHPKRR